MPNRFEILLMMREVQAPAAAVARGNPTLRMCRSILVSKPRQFQFSANFVSRAFTAPLTKCRCIRSVSGNAMVDDSRVAMGPALLHNPTAQEQMSRCINLSEAAASLIGDGDIVAMEGFTDTIASAAGHELIRPGRP